MFVEISGGKDGVAEYLVNGQKMERSFTRDEADKRVTLSGDLDSTNKIIKSLNYKENYLHVTLAFKEDFVSIEDLQKASNDFEKFIKVAYTDEEINFYSEAHLPKLKSYFAKNGELVIRKPHIHIVIPTINLMNGKKIEPLGYIRNNIQYIEAFKELHNQNFGFESPRDNMKNQLNSESSIISRIKGDIFERNKVEKEGILNHLIENKISNYKEFREYLETQGTVKDRNKGKSNEYLNLKFKHQSQGMNLKEFCFSKEFIEEYSFEDKIDFLQEKTEVKFVEKKEAYTSKQTEKYEADLKDWFDFKAKEIKYINYSNKFYKNIYKNLDMSQKIEVLNEKEKEFYLKNDLQKEIKNDVKDIKFLQQNEQLKVNKLESNFDSELAQKLIGAKEIESLKNINFSKIDIKETYKYLSKHKGLLNVKYELEKDEIIAGSKKLQVKELLVEQMNFNAREIHLLESHIRKIAKKFELENKDTQMKINTNIVVDKKDKNQVDYLQIGTVDKVGRMTGLVYDQADYNRKSSGLAYVIKDKVVSFEEFKTLPNAEEILAKKEELTNSQFSSIYSKTLRCNYQRENMILSEKGQSYANSKYNLNNEMLPVNFGVTQFTESRKLDKNLFTIAKEWLLEKYYNAKESIQNALTSRKDLAMSNIELIVELQKMKQKIDELQTYNQGLEMKQKALENEVQNEPREADKEDNIIKDKVEDKVIDSVKEKVEEFSKMDIYSYQDYLLQRTNLLPEDIFELSGKELELGKFMIKEDMAINSIESIKNFASIIDKIDDLTALDPSLNAGELIDASIKMIKNQNEKGIERD